MSDRPALLLSGGTGLVGGQLLPALTPHHAVRALTRNPGRNLPGGAEAVGWDGSTPPPDSLDGVAAVIHLAGEPVFAGRLDERRRRRIRASRVDSTRALVAAIAARPETQRPACLVSASAVGYYPDSGDRELTEATAPGNDFLSRVCRDWEAEALAATNLGVRVVPLRIGIVLARTGGALPRMALPFRFGLGGRLGDGAQFVPWIHIRDLVRLIVHVLGDATIRGPVNAVSPNPVRNRDLTRAIARTLGRPAFLGVPAFALRFALGELSGELLDSRRAVPAAALASGFAFDFPELAPALADQLG